MPLTNQRISEQEFSQEFKKFFLLEFTKELIKHSVTDEILKLDIILKKEKKEKKKEIKEKIQSLEKKLPPLIKKKLIPEKKPSLKPIPKFFKPLPKPPQVKRALPGRLRIPEIIFPPRLQYLKPRPTSLQIDLGKLNPLVNDPAVKVIESNGPDQNIIVRGSMGTKKTKINLDKEEIDDIIQKFSTATKIPVHEGVFRVVRGRLILSAIVSDVVGSKFMIKKMPPPSLYSRAPVIGRF